MFDGGCSEGDLVLRIHGMNLPLLPNNEIPLSQPPHTQNSITNQNIDTAYRKNPTNSAPSANLPTQSKS